MESDLIPHTASPVLAAKAVLILAPHPDDEVFGCAGAVMGHVAQGVSISEIQRQLGVSRPIIYKCIGQSFAAGMKA